MSTSINDVVFEVYGEFLRRQEKDLKTIAGMSMSSRIKKAMKNPFLLFTWPLRKIYGKLKARYDYCTNDYIRRLRNANRTPESMNIFTPTQKKFPDAKIAVYTVITGGYDDLKDPVYIDDDIDYYVGTDSSAVITHRGGGHTWRAIPVPARLDGLSNVKKQRYIKLHPDEILPEGYDYTVYIDGSFRITCDIKPLVYSLIDDGRTIAMHMHYLRDCIYDEAAACFAGGVLTYEATRQQMDFYRSQGMPEHFGLPESPVIIRKCNDIELHGIMNDWWKEIERFTHRDQLSLPYVLWKNGKDISYIYSLGGNVWKNPCFLYYVHKRFKNLQG